MTTMTDQQRDDTYNGWPNRETWAASLYIDNDEGTYNSVRDAAAAAARTEYPRAKLADELRDWFQSMQSDMIDGDADRDVRMMLADIGSLYRVEWFEIADALLSEIDD